MKKIIIGLIVVMGLIIIGLYVWDPTNDRYDLGELENVVLDSTKTYCKYKITKVTCETPSRYVVGDIICITCCTSRTKPWPPLVLVNNNCPKKIEFTQALNECTLEATRMQQTCTNCVASETKAVFGCPDP